jgi:Glycosyl transferases group 1
MTTTTKIPQQPSKSVLGGVVGGDGRTVSHQKTTTAMTTMVATGPETKHHQQQHQQIDEPIISSSPSFSRPRPSPRSPVRVRILLFQSQDEKPGFAFRSAPATPAPKPKTIIDGVDDADDVDDVDANADDADATDTDADTAQRQGSSSRNRRKRHGRRYQRRRRGSEDATDALSSRMSSWEQQISDELLNICLDGFERSSYFEVLEPTIIHPPNTTKSITSNMTSQPSSVTFLLKETQPVVWVIDVRRLFVTKGKSKYMFDPVIELLYNTRRWQLHELRQQQQQQKAKDEDKAEASLLLPSIHIVFMDYRDKWSRSFCKFRTNMTNQVLGGDFGIGVGSGTGGSNANTTELPIPSTPIELLRYMVGWNNVRHVRQQIVQGRNWDKDKRWINEGVAVPRTATKYLDQCFASSIPLIDGIVFNVDAEKQQNPTTTTAGAAAASSASASASSSSSSNENPYLHAPYTVRSDYVDAVKQTYRKYLPTIEAHQRDGDDRNRVEHLLLPPDTYRPIDACHLFNPKSKEPKAELRKAVSRTLLEIQQQQQQQQIDRRNNNITIIADSISVGAQIGRTSIQTRYLEVLLTCKVVVVAQRDEWEDHYRLFEAIVGGALVMTDFMWSLPHGYQDGVNIVVYRNLDDLRTKLLYYLNPQHESKRLTIAHAGWKLAMESHRTFHWMERIFFGRPLTTITFADTMMTNETNAATT